MSKLEEYLKNDRQWLRKDRIQHAVFQIKNAKTEEDKKFWYAVFDANKF